MKKTELENVLFSLKGTSRLLTMLCDEPARDGLQSVVHAGYDGIGIRDLKDSALEYGIEIEEGSDEQERDVAKT